MDDGQAYDAAQLEILQLIEKINLITKMHADSEAMRIQYMKERDIAREVASKLQLALNEADRYAALGTDDLLMVAKSAIRQRDAAIDALQVLQGVCRKAQDIAEGFKVLVEKRLQ